MRPAAAICLVLAALASLPSCGPQATALDASWTREEARWVIWAFARKRIREEKLGAVRIIKVTETGFDCIRVESGKPGEPERKSVEHVKFCDVKEVGIERSPAVGALCCMLPTAGIVGPNPGCEIVIKFNDPNTKPIQYSTTFFGARDWWKAIFPFWVLFPEGPTRTEEHRFAAAVRYMMLLAKERPAKAPALQ